MDDLLLPEVRAQECCYPRVIVNGYNECGRLTLKILDALERAVVLPSSWVIPFDSKPLIGLPLDRADKAHCAEMTLETQALAGVESHNRRVVVNVAWFRLQQWKREKKRNDCLGSFVTCRDPLLSVSMANTNLGSV